MNSISQKLLMFCCFSLLIAFPFRSYAQKSKANELVKLAIEQEDNGELDLAISNCNKALDYYPGSQWAYNVRGIAYYNKLDYDRAITDYNKAIELDQKYTIAYNNRGLAYHDKKDYDRAITDYNKAIELDSKYAAAYNNRGNAYKDKGNYDQAMEDYNKAIQLDPKYFYAYNNRGNIYKYKGNYDQAFTDYNKAIELNPKYKNAYRGRGIAYCDKKDYDRAIDDFNKAIELDPKYVSAYNNRGRAYYDKRNYDRAIEDYNKTLILDPNYQYAYNNRGLAYYDKKDYDRAIGDFNKAIELDPKYVSAYNNRGRVYYSKRDYDRAIEDYNNTIKLDPNYKYAYNNRGLVYYDKDDYDRAIVDFNRAIELDPKYVSAYNNRGNAYEDKADYDQAFIDYNKAIELDPKYTYGYNGRGLAYYYKGNYNLAVEDFKKTLQLSPLDKYALLNILPCFIRLNLFEQAGSYYQQYKTNNVSGYIETTGWAYYKFYLTAATIHVKNANYNQALAELKAGEAAYNANTSSKDVDISAKTSYADVLALKGYILSKLNKVDDALVAYNQALVINSNQPEVKEAIRNLSARPVAAAKKIPGKKNTQEVLGLSLLENSKVQPKYYAILIAEQNYTDRSIISLNQPINDALKLKRILQEKYTFSSANIDTLFNRKREDILSAISNKCNTLKENDNLLIFYAGHGAAEKDRFSKTTGYLVPTSAQIGNYYTYISSSELANALGYGDVKHILFIVDACFSGALTRELPKDAPSTAQSAYNLPSRHIMDSGGLKPTPDNSVFIHYLIKRLQENKEKYLTGHKLFNSFNEAVINNSDNRPGYEVIKNIGDEGGDFVFIKKD